MSPDSLNSPKSDNAECDNNFCKPLNIGLSKKNHKINDSLLYNIQKYYGSDSSDSDITLNASMSFDNLKTWKSFDSLSICNKNNITKEKISIENLSEDSGYGDQMIKSFSSNNLKETMEYNLERTNFGFSAYDGDIFQEVSWDEPI